MSTTPANTLSIKVRYTGGAHLTNKVGKLQASSTHSATAAAEALARKVFGPSLLGVSLLSADVSGNRTYMAAADADAFAYAWPSGRIDVGPVTADGAVCFGKGPFRALVDELEIFARHGQGMSAGLLLAPGVPEAETQDAAMDALLLFVDHLAKQKCPHGVHFGRFGELGKA